MTSIVFIPEATHAKDLEEMTDTCPALFAMSKGAKSRPRHLLLAIYWWCILDVDEKAEHPLNKERFTMKKIFPHPAGNNFFTMSRVDDQTFEALRSDIVFIFGRGGPY